MLDSNYYRKFDSMGETKIGDDDSSRVPEPAPTTPDSASTTPSSDSSRMSRSVASLKDLGHTLTSNLTVEWTIILFTTVTTLSYNVIPDMALDKIKRRNRILFNMTDDQVTTSNLTDFAPKSEFDILSSKQAADWSMKMLFVATLPAILLVTLLGSYSDKNGRKLPIILPIIGYFFNAIFLIMDAWFLDVDPETFLIAFIPIGLTGNIMTFMMGVSTYIAETSSPKQRTVRLALMELAASCGNFIGQLYLGEIYEKFGRGMTFVGCLIILILALTYTHYCVKETNDRQKDRGFGKRCGDLFKLGNVADSFKACFYRDRPSESVAIALLVSSLAFLYFVGGGELNIGYYYVHLMFKLSPSEYGYLKACETFAGVIGLLAIVPILQHCYHIRDEWLGVIAYFNTAMRPFIVALAQKPYVLYIAYLTGVLVQATGATVRSLMSKLVSKDELGKVFAVAAIFDAAAPTMAALVYPPLYKATLNTFPGACFLLSSAMFLLGIPALTIVWCLRKNLPDKNTDNGFVDMSG